MHVFWMDATRYLYHLCENVTILDFSTTEQNVSTVKTIFPAPGIDNSPPIGLIKLKCNNKIERVSALYSNIQCAVILWLLI